MDESEYENPGEFRPERWLDNKFGTKSKESEAVNDNRRITYAFKAGRRICSGQRLAENSLVSQNSYCSFRFDHRGITALELGQTR